MKAYKVDITLSIILLSDKKTLHYITVYAVIKSCVQNTRTFQRLEGIHGKHAGAVR